MSRFVFAVAALALAFAGAAAAQNHHDRPIRLVVPFPAGGGVASPGVGTGSHLFGQLLALQSGAVGDEFAVELRADIERWSRVVRDAKIAKE